MLPVQPTRLTDREFAHLCITELPEDIPVEWVRELAKRFYARVLTDERDRFLSDLTELTK